LSHNATNPLFRFDLFRILLALFFFIYVYVTAQGLIPLPDEPPRINFWGVFLVSTGMIVSFFCLIGQSRLFHLFMFAYLFIAQGQIAKRIKFLEMMLEPSRIEEVARYSLALVFIALCSEQAFRAFDRSFKETNGPGLSLIKKGVPF